MFHAGMTGVRLNLSHVTLPQAASQVEALHRAAARCNVKAQLLVDMQGPEIRVEAMEQPMEITEGSMVILGEGGIPVPAFVLPFLKPQQEVLLDDGKLLLVVTEQTANEATAQVLRGGILRGRKSIALPGAGVYPPIMTECDLQNIAVAKEYGVTGIMQPFVREHRDLETVRKALNDAGGNDIRLFAKIENLDGIKHLQELMPACDEIVIARGDLGNAVNLWELPALQKYIATKCNAAGKPFMVVTQMLATMEHNSVPTRAEVCDIFNAVLDGASSIMVTGETAVGDYPVDVIRYLVNTSNEGLRYLENTIRNIPC